MHSPINQFSTCD